MTRPTVLFATDFSKPSRQALDYAAVQARGMDARLLVVHVRERPVLSGEGILHTAAPFESRKELEARLRRLMPKDCDGWCKHYLLEGDPGPEIVDFAARENVDLIVLGTHGRTGLMRILMGSVAEYVLRRAPCPVLVVRSPLVAQADETPPP